MTNQLNAIFAALADPTRRAVISQLTQGPAPVSTLHETHDMALPTFLRHLRVLEDSGLVSSSKSGRVRTVTMQADALRVGTDWLEAHKSLWDGRLDRLTHLAQQMERTRT